MGDLYLDAGNSRVKLAVPAGGGWKTEGIFVRTALDELPVWLKENHERYERLIISCVVRPVMKRLLSACPRRKLLFLTTAGIPSGRIVYKNAETLGTDRFLAAHGAWVRTGGPVIVMDAGTACTIDYMDKNGIFRGGVIMPGLQTMESALSRSAEALPMAARGLPVEWPPDSTITGLQWGILGSFLVALNAHLDKFRHHDPEAEIWITGGDAPEILPCLDSGIRYEEFLIFYGMKEMFREFLRKEGKESQ